MAKMLTPNLHSRQMYSFRERAMLAENAAADSCRREDDVLVLFLSLIPGDSGEADMAYDAGFAGSQTFQARTTDAGYVTLGTRDMARAVRFYEPIAREMGIGRSVEAEGFVGWGLPGGAAGFGVALPEAAPMPDKGLTPLQAEDAKQVQRLYEIALHNGGSSESAPCERGGFYAAYFRDPDGNRLNAFCISRH